MLSVLVASAFLSALPPSAPADADEHATYQAARDQAGRDPEAHIKLALWCERHGMEPERLRHLTLALMADPQNTTARGLLGMVRDRNGKWVKTEQAADPDRQDPEVLAALGEYNRKRTAIDDHDPDDHWKLALWCEDQGLNAEAKAHFAAVVRLQPERDAAWKRLGCRKVDGRWMTDDQADAEKAGRKAQEEANRHWGPKFETWKRWLADPRKRSEAEHELAAVNDPRAVPSIWKEFMANRAPNHSRAVQLLGQIDAVPASRSLAVLSVLSPSEEARRRATESLRQRDPREYADLLIGMLQDSIEYEVKPTGGPGSPSVLLVKGQQYNLQRLYSAPPATPGLMPGDQLTVDQNGLPVALRTVGYGQTGYRNWQSFFPPLNQPHDYSSFLNTMSNHGPAAQKFGNFMVGYDTEIHQNVLNYSLSPFSTPIQKLIGASSMMSPLNQGTNFNFKYSKQMGIPIGQMRMEAEKAAYVSARQLEGDVRVVEANNQRISQWNERVSGVLSSVTGLDFKADREKWKSWYVDQLGYSYRSTSTNPDRPTFVQAVPAAYVPHFEGVQFSDKLVGFARMSCFGAGTPVHTLAGIRPIEQIQVGDLLLSQNTETGTLAYQPVLVTHHNPPSKTLIVNIGGEAVTASTFHRFWIAGQGWKMARELKAGDVVRTLDGLHSVDSIEPGKVQKVYNLDVAEGHSFFVAKEGVLVHDNSVPDLRSSPFDEPAVLASANPTAE